MKAENTSRNTLDRRTSRFVGGPIHSILLSFPIAYFTGAFVTDLVYWQTPDVIWETFSVWLITAGLIVAGIAAIAFAIDFVGARQSRTLTWPQVVGYAVAVLLSLMNVFIHSRDGYTAVVPTGLTLSGFVVVTLLLTSCVNGVLISRRGIGVGA
jgi:uncharacterized membrane protein